MKNADERRFGQHELSELMRWWHAVNDAHASGSARADRAALRHAASIDAVALTPAYQRLFRKLAEARAGSPWTAHEAERVAAIVGLAAHVKEVNQQSIPEAMSHREDGSDRNPVSELRFMRLLDSPDIDSLFSGLRRSLPLIDHTVDLGALAQDVFYWGDVTRKRWAYAYRWPDKTSA